MVRICERVLFIRVNEAKGKAGKSAQYNIPGPSPLLLPPPPPPPMNAHLRGTLFFDVHNLAQDEIRKPERRSQAITKKEQSET